MRRRVMSMLVGVTLAASTLLSAGPAWADSSGPASADTPPPEFGNDWHDPVTAAPPIEKPHTKSCEVTVAEAQFKDFTPYKGDYAPPEKCGKGNWGKVVLRLDGKVKGRQYDRLGYLRIGGVEVFRTSTPEPSVDGITWSVEKDVTRYRETLSRDQQVEMLIGNVVNETYTGIIDVKATLTFYEPEKHTTKQAPPDRVLPLGDATTVTTPRNSERIVAEVYATGSGGGCEEYWYLTVPDAAPYSCKADDGPYREVQVTVDGQLAGIATPFPTVWTGGWSNPFLWYVIPGPRAFDIKPIEYDLTPFAGLLNDGRPHQVEVSVAGRPEATTGWHTPTNILVWQDEKSERVTGKLTGHRAGELANKATYTPGSPEQEHRLDTRGSHRLSVSGYVDTSHGRVETTVTRALGNTSVHRWTEGESTDALESTWTDRETVTVNGRAVHTDRTYTMDGTTTLGAGDRLRTEIALGDRTETVTAHDGRRTGRSVADDRYEGDATYTANVPREDRHAVGTSRERYRVYGDGPCHDRTLATVQGTLTEDRLRC
ncbi:peptide-N4-asparagine amidase A [Streptomyces sp. NBC_01381]|uniref:peptide-N4-asparagine amidase n=1 Tax=Streptomyces sp. NBC_01381 TaxID=2903845 RepID=UPI00225B340F|nr:peptide-N4-asparagine amidase [Streptomyces sp. NBC_01381]MCX4673081.1 peptide-N4-asparagine amidase A [Streptomyces sp. NBC_01381]